VSEALAPLRRDLEVMASPVADRPGLLIRDPFRYTDAVMIVPSPLAPCLALFDGRSTTLDLREALFRITGDLRVGRGGTVKATVSAQSVVVSGELVGDCHAAHRVEIEASGKLSGNIRAPRVVIVEGATFRGNSDMSPRADGKHG